MSWYHSGRLEEPSTEEARGVTHGKKCYAMSANRLEFISVFPCQQL